MSPESVFRVRRLSRLQSRSTLRIEPPNNRLEFARRAPDSQNASGFARGSSGAVMHLEGSMLERSNSR
jgi:hypothetical protein